MASKHKPLEEYKLELKELNKEEKNKGSIKIQCPCGKKHIPGSDLNIHDKIAKCNSCDLVFSIEKDLSSLSSDHSRKVKQELFRPEGIDLFRYKDELDLSLPLPWGIWETLGIVFAPMFGFPLLFGGLTNGNLAPTVIGALLFLSLFIFLIRRIGSKIYISIADGFLSTRITPKWQSHKHYHIEDIDQLYVKLNPAGTHDLNMIINSPAGQRQIKLLPNIKGISKAHYLEQEIEKHLGIINREVPEEAK